MRIIKSSVEKWQQGYTPKDIWEHVARCARVCYQSEQKEGEDGESFCRRVIIPRKHLSVLEHGTIYMITLEEHVADFFYNNPYSKVLCATPGYCITTNLRVLIENDMSYLISDSRKPTKYHFPRTTFSFVTSLGIAREFNRHRVHSISEESTRYCNYTKGKFGSEITFIKPHWIKGKIAEHPKAKVNEFGVAHYSEDVKVDCWLDALNRCETEYNALIAIGCKPQEARSVLPLDTKTQSVHTAFDMDWNQFISLRGSRNAHPDARKLVNELKLLL